MKKVFKAQALAAALGMGLVLGLAGCGGGSASPPPQSQAQGNGLTLNTNNYVAVAQSTVGSMAFLGNAGGVVTGADVSSAPQLLPFVVDLAKRGLQQQGSGALLSGVETHSVVPCSQGGSIAVVFNDANNNNRIDAGDSLTMDAQSCVELGTTLQGRMTLQVQSLTGTYGSSSYSATLAISLTAFQATIGGNTSQGDGNINVTLSRTAAGVTDLVLDVPSLAISGSQGGQSKSTRLTSVHMTVRNEVVNGVARTSLSYSGTVAGSAFDSHEVQISTPQTLVVQGTDDFPSSGQLLVTGSGGSKLRLTALNKTQVQLELDADGDGVYETQITKTWLELR